MEFKPGDVVEFTQKSKLGTEYRTGWMVMSIIKRIGN